ncbi:MAG: hypothetical protein ABJD11_11305 [Gemmatimonadota bacterium]
MIQHSDDAPIGDSLTRDPLRDTALGRLLRAGVDEVPTTELRWEAIASHAVSVAMRSRHRASLDWWEITAGWRRPALAASVCAALLAAGLVVKRVSENAAGAGLGRAPRERIAIVEVAGGYTDEFAFTSLLKTAGDTVVENAQ